MRRWGKVIDMKSWTPGSSIRLLTLVVAIFIIPMQLFCDGLVRSKEQDMITRIQNSDNLPESCKNDDQACSIAMQVPYVIFSTEATVYMLFALLLIADSWLAYKTALVTGVGIYFMSFLQMCFKSGRPFWDVAEIASFGHCLFDFSGPSLSAFTMTFFWPYVQIMFLAKYYRSPSKFINWILLIILLIFWVDVYLFSLINGLNYIY